MRFLSVYSGTFSFLLFSNGRISAGRFTCPAVAIAEIPPLLERRNEMLNHFFIVKKTTKKKVLPARPAVAVAEIPPVARKKKRNVLFRTFLIIKKNLLKKNEVSS